MSGDEWARVAGPRRGALRGRSHPSHTACTALACWASAAVHWGKGRAEMMPLLLGQSPLNSPLTARHSELQWKPT